MKGLTLCADDFAQSSAISGGILQLLEIERLSAVSCFTESPRWVADAHDLLAVGKRPEIGLHFNLTHPFGQSGRRASSLLAAAMLGRIDPKWVRRRLDAQLLAFVEVIGNAPDFVDGHQHVHAFPGVRDVVIDYLAERIPGCRVRSLQPPHRLTKLPFKERLVAWVTRPLSAELAAAGLRTNRHFAGFRPYRSNFDFAAAFRKWLSVIPEDSLIMCHPGLPASDPGDPIAQCRPHELDYLASDVFLTDLQEAGITL